MIIGYFDFYTLFQIVVLNIFQEKSGGIYEKYLVYVREHNLQLNELFRSTLEMIPNGVMLIDIKSHAIRFANAEMHRILNGPNYRQSYSGLKLKVMKFIKHEDLAINKENHSKIT